MQTPLPTHFGPYPVRGLLGQGGMGAVYLAWHPTLEYELAIKTLVSQRAASEAARHRFQREIRALAELRHPGLLGVLGAGEQDGVPWFAMRLVKGGSLEDRIKSRGPLTLEETLELGVQLTNALGVAHQSGILHRDLKPDNVLCERGDRYVLTDFGLAKDLLNDASIQLSKTGALQGTPGYWAPEQAAGQGHMASPATDVYGVGGVLYAALTGRAPAVGESMVELIMAAVETLPAPPSKHGDSLPPLDAVVLRCLAKSPADRFPDMATLEAELLRLRALGRTGLQRQASSARGAGAFLALGGALIGGLGLGIAWVALADSAAPTQGAATPTRPSSISPKDLLKSAQAALARDEREVGLELLRRAAAAEDRDAMYQLGRALASTDGQRADPEAAASWFARAAAAGSPEAMLEFGRALAEGWGVDADEVEAAEWLRQAAELGLLEAKVLLGDLLAAGEGGISRDVPRARALFEQAAAGGHPGAMTRIGRQLARDPGGDEGLEQAVAWYRKAAASKDPEGMVLLAESLTRGQGVPVDLESAARVYQRASDAGWPAGMHGLGLALLKGRGVTRAPSDGIRLLTRAADGGYAPAMVSLGQAYARGEGVAADTDRARALFQRASELAHAPALTALAKLHGFDKAEGGALMRRAAEAGDPEAMLLLAREGVKRGDLSGGRAWARRGAELGSADCMLGLAELLKQSDPAQALVWQKRAAALGHLTAMVNLGWALQWGSGVPRDPKAALRWYRRAAEGGATQAMLNIGLAYGSGNLGLPRDLRLALDWHLKAAEAGDEEGLKEVILAYHEGRGVPKDPSQVQAWVDKALASKKPQALASAGGQCYHSQDYEGAAKFYRLAADAGFGRGLECLGDLHIQGLGVAKDEVKARELILRGAEAGAPGAMTRSGHLLLEGTGGPKDPRGAVSWLQRAAKLGETQGMLLLAVCYEQGTGVEKNRRLALEWYRKAAAKAKKAQPKRAARAGIKRLERSLGE